MAAFLTHERRLSQVPLPEATGAAPDDFNDEIPF